jgi:ABC-2 type transport system permease protein
MSACRAVISARFRMLLQYRAAAAAGLGTQLFWGLIRIMIFDAFYRSTTAPQPMSFPEIVTYVWLSQAFMRMLPWTPDPDVRAMIREGNVAYELLRPVDLYNLWYSRALANLTSPTLLRCVPMLVLASLFLGMQPPASLASALAAVVAMTGAVFLASAISNVLSISMMWTLSGEGVTSVMGAAVWLLSGMILPLPLFPEWAQAILNALPFRGLMDTPFRLYMGHVAPSHAAPVLAHQLVWTAALVLLGRWLLARGTRRLVVQGG